MYLKEIQLINFKNYADKKYQFSSGINCIVGLNGVGKTNLLDAIYYLSMSKSYFSSMDLMNILHGENFFAIHGDFVLDDIAGMSKISCIQENGKRKILKFNQKEYNRLSEHIGLIPSVMISPYDVDYINGLADVRRRYFDSILSQLNKEYLDKLMAYNKLLANRNAVLKTMNEKGRFVKEELLLWDERLSDCGTYIYEKRSEFIQSFLPVFARYFSIISSEKEQIDIVYHSQLSENSLFSLLCANHQKDFYAQHTSCGIHKDDFLFTMNTYPVKRFCSQGQQKSFLIALKLAQGDYIQQLKHKQPLLLLDDVFDKLDEQRISKLLCMVAGDEFGQVFITDTDKNRIVDLLQKSNLEINLITIE